MILTAGVVLAGVAAADGDPASDVLVTGTLFLPSDAGASVREQGQLEGLLAEAAHAGYPLRVALIASPADLGSVTPLWRQPQNYAEFLGEELSLVFKGTVLTVMPNGFGLYRTGGPSRVAGPAVLSSLSAPGSSGAEAAASLTAIQRLAAASGHPLSLTAAASEPVAVAGSPDAVAWIVFLIGAGLIGFAWVISLRVQPFRAKPRRTTGPQPR